MKYNNPIEQYMLQSNEQCSSGLGAVMGNNVVMKHMPLKWTHWQGFVGKNIVSGPKRNGNSPLPGIQEVEPGVQCPVLFLWEWEIGDSPEECYQDRYETGIRDMYTHMYNLYKYISKLRQLCSACCWEADWPLFAVFCTLWRVMEKRM